MAQLVCMRLANMRNKHPDQDNSHVCGSCGEIVGIYPSGQNVLKQVSDMKIICEICAGPNANAGEPAPGALGELFDFLFRKASK